MPIKRRCTNWSFHIHSTGQSSELGFLSLRRGRQFSVKGPLFYIFILSRGRQFSVKGPLFYIFIFKSWQTIFSEGSLILYFYLEVVADNFQWRVHYSIFLSPENIKKNYVCVVIRMDVIIIKYVLWRSNSSQSQLIMFDSFIFTFV